jgi:galactose-1-phosphate uridylyltransferase|tara:strand:- start:316 stop:654 length:339 start_codon:yes stop_codon:yes gene_type:complete
MAIPIDSQKTLEVIERMKLAKIGEYKKWEAIIKKIKNKQSLNPRELEYYANLTRIYKNSSITSKSKMYHTKLSELDEKPPCKICGENSLYYCNMNDQYFCTIHVVGHDENEF